MPQQTKFQDALLADERFLFSVSLWSGLSLADAILWSRRLSGALTIPLSAPLIWGSCLGVTATAICALIFFRIVLYSTPTPAPSHPLTPSLGSCVAWWPELLTLGLPVAWGLALGLQSSPLAWGGLIALWGMLIVAVGLVRVWIPQEVVAEEEDAELASDVVVVTEAPADDQGAPTAEDIHPAQFQQRSVVDGVEVIEGEVAVRFDPGQREATIHLSFCPPFAVVPEVHAEDALGGELEVRVEAIHPFGARLSIRRASPVEAAQSHQISYFASPSATGEAAA